MSQYDFGTIDPYTDDGVTLADMLNNWRDAIHSWHRGAARPSYAVPGMAWINDNGGPANWLVMVYLGPTVGDVVLFTYDTTTGVISNGGGMLLAQAAADPSVRWQATGNAANLKAWRATEKSDGTLRFGAYNDAGAEVAGITFQRDGKLIADLSGSSGIPSPLVVGPTPPASPQPNQLWWNSDNSTAGGGRLYLYFVDVDTSQWVPASPPLGIAWTAPPSSDASSMGIASGVNYWAGGDTAMQITNGVQLISRVFTASDPSHPIEVDAVVYIAAPNSTAAHAIVGLFIDGAANAVAQGMTTAPAGSTNNIPLYWQGALAAGPHTFQLRLGSLNTAGVYTNMSDAGHTGGGAQKNTMVVREVGVGAVGPQGAAGPGGATRTYDEYTANAALAVPITVNDTVPLATAGTTILSHTVTVAAGQRVRARFQGFGATAAAANISAILTRSGSANALRAVTTVTAAVDYAEWMGLEYEDAPGAGTFTYGINVGASAGSMRMNGASGARWFGGTAAATLTLEIFTP